MLFRSSTIRQFLRDARASFRRNGLMTAAAVTTLTVALLTVGCAVATGMNLNHLAATLNAQVEIVAFLREELRPADVPRIHAAIAQTAGVAGVRFVPRAEALARLERRLGASPAFADLARHNPLPDSFDVRVEDAGQTTAVADAIQRLPGVEDVSYAAQVVDRLVAATRVMRLVGALLTIMLSAVAVIVVTNTLRLTVLARWREIEIMELVGATRWFIRWPFLIEGMLQGMAAAAAAGAVLLIVYTVASSRLQSGLPFLPIVPPGQVAGSLVIVVLGFGVTLGALGSLVAVRRFLTV